MGFASSPIGQQSDSQRVHRTSREGEPEARQPRPGRVDRCCIRSADVYDTASLRRQPARRPSQRSALSSVTYRRSLPRPVRSSPVDRRRGIAASDAGPTRRPGRMSTEDAPTELDRGHPVDGERGGKCMKFRNLSALAAVAVLALSACTSTPSASTAAGASGGTGLTPTSPKPAGRPAKGKHTIASGPPPQGSEQAASGPITDGVKLAGKLAGGTAGGYAIDIPQSALYDDALNGAHDPQTGANNMGKIVAD